MKHLIPILIAATLCSGCLARKIVTIPAGIVVKTTAKTTEKIAIKTTEAIIPNSDDEEK